MFKSHLFTVFMNIKMTLFPLLAWHSSPNTVFTSHGGNISWICISHLLLEPCFVCCLVLPLWLHVPVCPCVFMTYKCCHHVNMPIIVQLVHYSSSFVVVFALSSIPFVCEVISKAWKPIIQTISVSWIVVHSCLHIQTLHYTVIIRLAKYKNRLLMKTSFFIWLQNLHVMVTLTTPHPPPSFSPSHESLVLWYFRQPVCNNLSPQILANIFHLLNSTSSSREETAT